MLVFPVGAAVLGAMPGGGSSPIPGGGIGGAGAIIRVIMIPIPSIMACKLRALPVCIAIKYASNNHHDPVANSSG